MFWNQLLHVPTKQREITPVSDLLLPSVNNPNPLFS